MLVVARRAGLFLLDPHDPRILGLLPPGPQHLIELFASVQPLAFGGARDRVGGEAALDGLGQGLASAGAGAVEIIDELVCATTQELVHDKLELAERGGARHT